MAVHRKAPTCPHCGKVIGKAVFQDQSDLPVSLRIIGDTFLRWECEEHECEEQKEFIKNLPKINL